MAYSRSALASLSWNGLLRLYEHLHAVRTDDPYFPGAPDDGAARRNADFVLVFAACLPDLRTGDVTIGGRGLFQADDGFRQGAVEIMLVEFAEHLFQLASGTGRFNGLFHDFLPFLLIKKAGTGIILLWPAPAGVWKLCTAQTLVGGRCMGLFSGNGQAGADDGLAVKPGAREVGQTDFVTAHFQIIGCTLCQRFPDLDLQSKNQCCPAARCSQVCEK